jgi:hypothetical protein
MQGKSEKNKRNDNKSKNSKSANSVINEKDTDDMHKPVRGLQKQ